MQVHRPNPAPSQDSEHQRKLLNDALTEPDWRHEAARAGLSLVLRKGALILGLGILCALFFNNAPSPLVPVLAFLIGTTFILAWNWNAPESSD